MVDEGGLQRQVVGGVDAVSLFLGGFGGRLTDCEKVELGVVSLVEEELVSHALYDHVPGVGGPRAAHQRGQDGVRGEHVALRLGKLRNANSTQHQL